MQLYPLAYVPEGQAHACSLQFAFSLGPPVHWAPPCCGDGLLQLRERVFVPRPQGTEQLPQLFQLDQPPLMGQLWVLHFAISVSPSPSEV